jgi:hypothetical protein
LLLSPLGEGQSPSFKQTWIPSTKDDLCPVWLKLAQWFWRRRFLNDLIPFLHFWDYLALEEDLALYLNKLEFPSPKDNVYQVWLNLACWFWRRRFLKCFSVFLLFCYYLLLERGNSLHLIKLESPPPKDDLCQVWFKLAQRFWRRSRKCKSLQIDRQTDGQKAIRIVHLRFQLRWAKMLFAGLREAEAAFKGSDQWFFQFYYSLSIIKISCLICLKLKVGNMHHSKWKINNSLSVCNKK